MNHRRLTKPRDMTAYPGHGSSYAFFRVFLQTNGIRLSIYSSDSNIRLPFISRFK